MLNGSGDLSGNDFDELKDAEGSPVMEDENITIDHVMHMDADAFEVLCQLLWQKQGYPLVYRTKKSGDGGIDVVAIKGTLGALIQAKSSLKDGKHLGWEGIKDVVAGEAAYKAKHSGVSFTKISITNQFFSNDAKRQADHNNVALVDQPKLSELLRNYQVTVFELEKGLS
jgi:HJR/Mrr/RecB family endonuclease